MSDKTVLYYTGNRKTPAFESKVRKKLAETCYRLPVISVSQKPIDFGWNICVGEVGASYLNVYRQMLIGAEAVRTKYIVFAEDDCLYPPEYFEFNPEGGDFYRYDNAWMVLKRGGYYRTKPIGGAQIAKRDFIVRKLADYLAGEPEWDANGYVPQKPDFMGAPFELFTGPPVVAFKASGNLSGSGYTTKETTRNLVPWGDVAKLRQEYDFA